jgi:hypothetical protein
VVGNRAAECSRNKRPAGRNLAGSTENAMQSR